MGFSYEDILYSLGKLNIAKDDTILVRTDLRYLGPYNNGLRNLPADLYKALTSVIDLNVGTLVTPTSNIGLCNTDTVFDTQNTASEMGVLAEYIRKQHGAIRSMHPFLSYTALGKDAEFICTDTARHGFGPETPKARLIEQCAKVISIGIPPHLSCTTVHHVEFMMGVPYRYVKEFMHPVLREGEVKIEPFYLYVWYKECDIKRDSNKKSMGTFDERIESKLGNSQITSYSIKSFYNHCVKLYKEDIYTWLAEEPTQRPYRQ